jgi:hypothetical protein
MPYIFAIGVPTTSITFCRNFNALVLRNAQTHGVYHNNVSASVFKSQVYSARTGEALNYFIKVRKGNFHGEDLPANLPYEKRESMKTCGFHALIERLQFRCYNQIISPANFCAPAHQLS